MNYPKVNMPQRIMNTFKIVNLIEGFHLLQGVNFLYENNLLKVLESETQVDLLAEEFKFDREKLTSLLWYLSERTDIIKNLGNNTYQLNEEYFSYRKSGFLIEQYIGAYDFDSKKIEQSLKEATNNVSFVNEAKHAMAFEKLEGAGFPFLKKLIQQIGSKSVLEFGCGAGNLLINLSKEDADFKGIGVDSNAKMCLKFQQNIAKYNLSGQLTILEGNAENPREVIPTSLTDQVELIVAASLVNSFFHGSENDKTDRIVKWLSQIKSLFPKRHLLILDYYGRLGNSNFSYSPESLVHDWVQLISNQGIPPVEMKEWEKIYEEANCKLIDTMEPKKSVIPFFIHLVAL
jgi:cyclopropane fatty-acyl-phospholipid synthase-like methyltransferase